MRKWALEYVCAFEIPDEVADIVIEQFKLVANEKDEKEYRFGI